MRLKEFIVIDKVLDSLELLLLNVMILWLLKDILKLTMLNIYYLIIIRNTLSWLNILIATKNTLNILRYSL